MLKRIDEKNKLIIISSFLWGILAHGFVLFNKYSWHDDSILFGVGASYTSGRWFLNILSKVVGRFFGGHFSLPLYNGFLSISFIAISLCIIIEMLDIRDKYVIIAVSGILVSFPMVTGLFGFMFTAPYYMFSLLMSSCGAFLICKYRKWYTFLSGTFLVSCAIGIYQAFIPFTISILLFYLIHIIDTSNNCKWKKFVEESAYIIFAIVISVSIYFVFNHIILIYYGETLSSYRGINNMGREGVVVYLNRIRHAYIHFFSPRKLNNGKENSVTPMKIGFLYQIMILMTIVLSIYKIYLYCREGAKNKALQLSVLMLFIPLAINFIFVMCDPSVVYMLMVYGQSMIFVYFGWLIGNTHIKKES